MAASPALPAGAAGDAPEQRRTLVVLVCAQILSGAGLAAGITVGALLAQEMLGSTSLAGVPSTLFTLGSALAAVFIGVASGRSGRRVGLAAGYAVGALGSLGVIVAAVTDSSLLLFASLFVYGAGSAANLQARYAGADLAAPPRRARALSTVLVATTVGAVVGPTLTGLTGDMAVDGGLPRLAGPFVLATVAYSCAALVLWIFLRPDPLLRALAISRDDVTGTAGDPGRSSDPVAAPGTATAPSTVTARNRGVALGATVMVVTQIVMVAIMTMTPVHMAHHGHVGAVGLVIAIHVGAMYLPSPLSGRLVDRHGPRTVAVLAAVTLLGAGLVAAVSGSSVVLVAIGLALLGLGWSLGLVAGTTLVTDAAPLATRARTQGRVDVLVALAGAAGGALSGVVVAGASYTGLALGGGVLALVLVPVVARGGRPRP
ncbi:Predicted arabinose efflux permease, MFS family [Paraoerskovia marina]|uniref:Predicted arabinose efflux permease, MFS family n=1 Tax=Paraoerskovia marina TaxID=545619 RepID=A0A1H1U6D5_9CELL|nr:MFS transporter [Paraoerskovia marina]SDS67974.1 Predicted arabinose efflux permease, MFS family [Paraoerskovia marina]